MPAQHFRLALFGAVGRVTVACRDGDIRSAVEAHPFLARYLEQIAPHFELDEWVGGAWAQALAEWESRATQPLPMVALLDAGVSRLQLDLMLAAGLIEEDSRFGDVFEAARGGDRRPTFGLLLAWWRVDADGTDRTDAVQAALLELIHTGLLHVLNPEAPRADWMLTVPSPLWDALAGVIPCVGWLRYIPMQSLPRLADYVAPQLALSQCLALPQALQAHPDAVLLVRGPRHNGRKTLLGAVARELGMPLMLTQEPIYEDETRWRLFGALCTLLGALPVIERDLQPGENRRLPALPWKSRPLCLATSRFGAWSTADARALLAIELPMPSECERVQHWLATLGEAATVDVADLAATNQLTSGNIRRKPVWNSSGSSSTTRYWLKLKPPGSRSRNGV